MTGNAIDFLSKGGEEYAYVSCTDTLEVFWPDC